MIVAIQVLLPLPLSFGLKTFGIMMIGRTISHYRILEKLGAGGMGVVYKAEDARLQRMVALKFLSSELTREPEAKARFVREARAAAALDHANICTVYEIDEAEDRIFIAMAFIEGRSLKEKIQAGPLALPAALDLGIQVAEGLSEAHRMGMIHRDIKPANIMIAVGGRAKILDFGLAIAPGATRITRNSIALGTVCYMSPEQARAQPVDHRTDIWAMGVMLYEMVTGSPPFGGDHEQVVLHAILSERQQPVTGLRTGVPLELERLIDRCLEKDPGVRYQTAGDLAADLGRVQRALGSGDRPTVTISPKPGSRRRWPWLAVAAAVLTLALAVLLYPRLADRSGPSSSGARLKLAVLPFENLGAEEDEYFADGITDAITARLAGIGGLGVISRQSTVQYKGSHKSMKEIGDELGVDYILEGTIQLERAGDPTSRIRIIPQLIGVPDDVHLWANTYDEEMTEVFRVQSEIAERVAHALSVTLLDTEREVLAAIPTDNLEAYEFYLRGKELLGRRYSWKNIKAAVQMLKRAVALDDEFAAAWAELSISYVWDYWWTISSYSDSKTAAKAAVDRAREINPDSPDVQVALGYYYYYGELDFDRALEHFEAARSSRPNDAEVLSAMAFVKRRQGHWEECAALLEHAAELNPRFVNTATELGITYTFMRQYEKGRRYLERSIFLDPEHPLGYVVKALGYIVAAGDTARARQTLLSAANLVAPGELGISQQPFNLVRILPATYVEIVDRTAGALYAAGDTTAFRMGLAELYHQLGRDEEAHRIWNEELADLSTTVSPLFQPDIDLYAALIHASLGRSAEAIRITDEVLANSLASADAVLGTLRVEMAALIYVRAGTHEQAIDQLELLLSIPSQTSRVLLRLDPAWDPLRDNPRFRKLVMGEQ
jgi:serine/threonine protein kinase